MNLYKVVDQNGKQVFEDLLIARQVTEKTGCTKNNVAQAAANFALVGTGSFRRILSSVKDWTLYYSSNGTGYERRSCRRQGGKYE